MTSSSRNHDSNQQLRPKQAAFVQEYLDTGNASVAYRRAYPASLKWTKAALSVEASRMLKHPKVPLAVSKALERAANAARLNHECIISGLMRNPEGAKKCDPPQNRASNRALELLARRGTPDIVAMLEQIRGHAVAA